MRNNPRKGDQRTNSSPQNDGNFENKSRNKVTAIITKYNIVKNHSWINKNNFT